MNIFVEKCLNKKIQKHLNCFYLLWQKQDTVYSNLFNRNYFKFVL
jgi:hypothetical protein